MGGLFKIPRATSRKLYISDNKHLYSHADSCHSRDKQKAAGGVTGWVTQH